MLCYLLSANGDRVIVLQFIRSTACTDYKSVQIFMQTPCDKCEYMKQNYQLPVFTPRQQSISNLTFQKYIDNHTRISSKSNNRWEFWEIHVRFY